MATKAITTILIGENYHALWNQTFRATWEAYARKHGYDLLIIPDYLDQSPLARQRTPHWQKCLILDHPQLRPYEDVVWIDADILINPHTAPCIVAANAAINNGEGVGVVTYCTEFLVPGRIDNRYHRRAYSATGGRLSQSPRFSDWYQQAGLPGDVDDFINTGVLVFKPRLHADFMRKIYLECTENDSSHKENGALSYWLLKEGLASKLDPRFNVSWNGDIIEFYPFLLEGRNFHNTKLIEVCVNTAWHNAFMLHFVESETRSHASLVNCQHPLPPGLRLPDSAD